MAWPASCCPRTCTTTRHLGAVLSIGFAYWPQFARVTRATTLAEKNKDYVNAARIIGVPGARIALGHVLPNAWGPVLVIATIELALGHHRRGLAVLSRGRHAGHPSPRSAP